ncbi:MAG: four helix bundle protein [Bacteroidota bacterium]
MASFKRFEDIEAWQAARGLVQEVYAATNVGAFQRDLAQRDQIRRAAISVPSNIAEGFERGGDRDFARFLHIAKGSVAEVRSQLYCALDFDYLDQDTFDRLYDLTDQISRQLRGLIRYLSRTGNTRLREPEAPYES